MLIGRSRRLVVVVGVALFAVAAAAQAPVAAQTPPTTEAPTATTRPATTTTAPTTTTSDAPTTTAGPSTTSPEATTTTTVAPTPPTLPAPDPVDQVQEDGSEPSPTPLPVPPRAAPRVLTPTDGAVTKVVTSGIRASQTAANAAVADQRAADKAVADLEARQSSLQRTYDTLHAQDAQAAERLSSQRAAMRTRTVALYMEGGARPVIPVGADVHDYGRRQVLVQALLDVDRRNVTAYRAAKAAAGDDVTRLVAELEGVNGQVIAARANAEQTAKRAQQALGALDAVQLGGQVAVNGFVFPVGNPHNFVDTFGAPRMTGTAYSHSHQGTDIFAPYGTPVVACERGFIFKKGTDRLGGTKLWIGGESGTTYYYAHLSAFADGLTDGQLVEAGDLVGYVGTSGNAVGTPPHTHFQIHPGGGSAINPYPTLKTVDDAVKQFGPRVPTTAAPSAATSAASVPPAP